MRAPRHLEIAEPSGSTFREVIRWSNALEKILSPQEGQVGPSCGRGIIKGLDEILRMNTPLSLSQSQCLVLVGFHEMR